MVLKDVYLELEERKLACLVGPSGSGKTTLLKAVLGLVDIPHGSVKVFGKNVDGNSPTDIGYVPQMESVDWNFPVTAEQIVMMGLHDKGSIWPWPSAQEVKKVHALLDRLNIFRYRSRHIKELSGGQQQRVFLARALIRNPKLLLLDEPTNGIDVKARHELFHLLDDLHRKGMTVLLTTHDLNAVAAHLPWIICFNKRLIAQGPPKKIFTAKILSETYNAPLYVIQHTGVVGYFPVVTEAPVGIYGNTGPTRYQRNYRS